MKEIFYVFIIDANDANKQYLIKKTDLTGWTYGIHYATPFASASEAIDMMEKFIHQNYVYGVETIYVHKDFTPKDPRDQAIYAHSQSNR